MGFGGFAFADDADDCRSISFTADFSVTFLRRMNSRTRFATSSSRVRVVRIQTSSGIRLLMSRHQNVSHLAKPDPWIGES
jgi:hypothetical protein